MKTEKCSSWCAGVMLAIALVVVYPAIPSLAAPSVPIQITDPETIILLADDPLVIGVRALAQTINMPASMVPGDPIQVENLVYQAGELSQRSDGRWQIEIDVSAYEGGSLVPIGQTLVLLSGDRIETVSQYDLSGEVLRIDGAITPTVSGDLELEASMNGGEEFVLYEFVNGELSQVAGDAEAFGAAQLPLQMVGATSSPETFWPAVFAVIVMAVFVYIAVCSYGALTGRFTC